MLSQYLDYRIDPAGMAGQITDLVKSFDKCAS